MSLVREMLSVCPELIVNTLFLREGLARIINITVTIEPTAIILASKETILIIQVKTEFVIVVFHDSDFYK